MNSVVDINQTRSAIRIRSGGRAAIFLTNDGKYEFVDVHVEGKGKVPILKAGMLDTKGIGTHVSCTIDEPRKSGFLNYADAIRELGN